MKLWLMFLLGAFLVNVYFKVKDLNIVLSNLAQSRATKIFLTLILVNLEIFALTAFISHTKIYIVIGLLFASTVLLLTHYVVNYGSFLQELTIVATNFLKWPVELFIIFLGIYLKPQNKGK